MEKKKIKAFGKVLYVLAIIARVCMWIGIVVLALAAIAIPLVFKSIKIDDKKITIVGLSSSNIDIYKGVEGKLLISYDGKTIPLAEETDSTELLAAEVLYDKLTGTTTGALIAYLEGSVILAIVTLALMTVAIKNLEDFCKSLKDSEEIFTKDKPEYLRKAALFMIITLAVSVFTNGVLGSIFNNNVDLNVNTFGVIEILVLYLASYLFEYGATLEKKPVTEIAAEPAKKTTTSSAKKTTKKKTEEK